MCRSYGEYIRACARTGRRGDHVPVAEATFERGHLTFAGPGLPRLRPDAVMYHFQIQRPDSLPAEIAEVRRRYEPLDIEDTEIDGSVYVSVRVPKAMPGLVERMETFDWLPVADRDGLPRPAQREVKAQRRRRRGRIEQYALTVVFEREPPANAITAIAAQADDNPARRSLQQMPSGKWMFSAWRDRGWDHQEWQLLWQAIHRWHGRAYQQGDHHLVNPSLKDQGDHV